jgi:hypothetical protein
MTQVVELSKTVGIEGATQAGDLIARTTQRRRCTQEKMETVSVCSVVKPFFKEKDV